MVTQRAPAAPALEAFLNVWVVRKGVTSPPVSAPTGSPASLMALAGGRAAPWPWRPKHSGSSAPEEVGFAADSLLEGSGFELPVPSAGAGLSAANGNGNNESSRRMDPVPTELI